VFVGPPIARDQRRFETTSSYHEIAAGRDELARRLIAERARPPMD